MAFYTGNVYFEKLRVKEGKNKSKKREEMEYVWKDEGGFSRDRSHNMHITLFRGERAKLDKLGQLQIKGTPTGGGMSRRKLVKN